MTGVLLLTHLYTYSIIKKFNEINNIPEYQNNTYILLDISNNINILNLYKEYIQEKYIITYDNTILNKYSYFDYTKYSNKSINHFHENIHIPILYFMDNFLNYNYVWIIEYDVYFTDKWELLLNNFKNTNYDLIATYIKTQDIEPNWYWFNFLNDPNNYINKWYGAFYPIYKISRNGIFAIKETIKHNVNVHSEVLIMSSIIKHNLSWFDLQYAEINNKFIISRNTFWYLPLKIDKIYKGMLYHPIKNFNLK